MTVYVDDVFIPYGRMKMCHMIADTEEELHEMADKIGMRREWFQAGSRLHYDVSKSRRTLAIEYGAIEITIKELVAMKKVLGGEPEGFFCPKCGNIYPKSEMRCLTCNPIKKR